MREHERSEDIRKELEYSVLMKEQKNIEIIVRNTKIDWQNVASQRRLLNTLHEAREDPECDGETSHNSIGDGRGQWVHTLELLLMMT